MAKLKAFRDVKATEYRVKETVTVPVTYKVVNGQVIIDLKSVVDGILDEQEIAKYDTKRMELAIPFSLDKQVTGNSMSVGIDKKRYILRLKNLEIIPSKQQKIDYDNTHPHRWKNPQWFKFIESLFYDAYGFAAMDITSRGKSGWYARGKNDGLLKNMKEAILNIEAFETDSYSIVEYLRWVFDTKSGKTSLGMGLICSKTMIQDWVINKKRQLKKKGQTGATKIKRKWD